MKTLMVLVCLLSLLVARADAANTYVYRDNSVVVTSSQISLTDTNSTTAFTLGPYQAGAIQCVYAGVNLSQNATYRLQVSNNNTNWDNVSGSSTTIAATEGSGTWIVDPLVSRYGRIYVSSTSSAGVLDCITVLKKY